MLLSFYFRGKLIFSVPITTKEADFFNEATPLEEEQITLTDVGSWLKKWKRRGGGTNPNSPEKCEGRGWGRRR